MLRTALLAFLLASGALLVAAPTASACMPTSNVGRIVCGVIVAPEYVGEGAFDTTDCTINQEPPANWASVCVPMTSDRVVFLFVDPAVDIVDCLYNNPPRDWVELCP